MLCWPRCRSLPPFDATDTPFTFFCFLRALFSVHPLFRLSSCFHLVQRRIVLLPCRLGVRDTGWRWRRPCRTLQKARMVLLHLAESKVNDSLRDWSRTRYLHCSDLTIRSVVPPELCWIVPPSEVCSVSSSVNFRPCRDVGRPNAGP